MILPGNFWVLAGGSFMLWGLSDLFISVLGLQLDSTGQERDW
jgi:bacterial/archaeal transporter family-2 protein